MNKWIIREDDITTLCFTIIDKTNDQIEKTYDQASDLLSFDQNRDMLLRKLRIYPYNLLSFENFTKISSQ